MCSKRGGRPRSDAEDRFSPTAVIGRTFRNCFSGSRKGAEKCCSRHRRRGKVVKWQSGKVAKWEGKSSCSKHGGRARGRSKGKEGRLLNIPNLGEFRTKALRILTPAPGMGQEHRSVGGGQGPALTALFAPALLLGWHCREVCGRDVNKNWSVHLYGTPIIHHQLRG